MGDRHALQNASVQCKGFDALNALFSGGVLRDRGHSGHGTLKPEGHYAHAVPGKGQSACPKS
jgi:hypothetical protein